MLTFFKRIVVFFLCIGALLVPVSAQERTHVVQRGENLYRIGLRYGCTVAQMSAANGITNPNRIFAGQTLLVPTCSGVTTATTPAPTTTTTTTGNTSAIALTNTDNWCYGGRPWGDGRCTPPNDPALREWYWKGGWYIAQVERGALRPEQVPSEFQVLVPIAFPNLFTTTNGSTSSGSTSGSTTGGGTVCTGGTVLQLVNCARAANGLAALSSNGQLDTAALNHANDMVTNNFFSHTGSNGSSVGDRVTATGFVWNAVGENIAQGQTSDQAVFDAWMNSAGHRANILNGSYTRMGLARVGNTWVQVFAAP